jgi:hypothetical protein
MPNPFPGIDPYVEAQLNWSSLHTRFLTYVSATQSSDNSPPAMRPRSRSGSRSSPTRAASESGSATWS